MHPDWDIATTQIVYRGTRRQLPEFLPPFTIPVPRAWFDVLFLEREEKKRTVYTADAYAVATGYIVYDCERAYTASVWADAVKIVGFAVQVEWAESAKLRINSSVAPMKVSVFIPDQHRQKLEKQRTYRTTQGQFVQFLRSGELTDLGEQSVELVPGRERANMEATPRRLKVVPRPEEAYSILSVPDIQQWAQGHYPNEEKREEQSLLLDDHGQPRNRSYNHTRLTDRAMDKLLGICKGVVADGDVNEQEAQFLIDWITVSREAAEQWPTNILYQRLAEMLIDHSLDRTEQTELLSLLHQIVTGGGPPGEYVANLSTSLPLTRPAPAIHFHQRYFCFTGRFIFGTRKQCEEAVLAKGGTVQKVLTGETNYLVIGISGSTDWIHSTHGRKIEKAVEFQSRGHSLAIISEEHWMQSLN